MSGEVNILIDEIEAIAQQTRSQIASAAQEGAGEFANATLDAGAFAGIPPGLAFHARQATAHQVYSEILTGVVADLEAFADALASNAANHRAVDESNADTMTSMEARRADEAAAATAMGNVNDQYAGDDALESEEVYEENYDEDVAAEAGAASGYADSDTVEAPADSATPASEAAPASPSEAAPATPAEATSPGDAGGY